MTNKKGSIKIEIENVEKGNLTKKDVLNLGRDDFNDDIFLSPTGSDSNLGTKESPLFNLNTAINKLTPGHTIFMLPGTYSYDKQVLISDSKDGTEDKPYKIQAYDWQEVVLDFSSQPWGNNSSNYVGIYLKGDYWKIQGITVFCAGDNGIKIEGSHNYIGRCITHHNFDTGIQLGFGHHDENPTGELCAYNVIENCDSYLNYDYHGKGGNADGFACKMHNGKENYFIGCRSWNNSDDAWDLYETDYAVHLIDCWAWNSGEDINFTTDEIFTSQEIANKKSAGGNKVSPVTGCQGNGNGIKLGGNGEGGDSKGIHTATNCVVFECDDAGDSVKGFDENSHKGGIVLENCVSFDNCKNYMFENGGSNSSFKNNISFQTENCRKGNATRPGEIGTSAKLENNNFVSDGGDLLINKDMVFTADDFITIKEEDALAPRQQDGSLPNNGFCRIKETSKFYNSGMGLK